MRLPNSIWFIAATLLSLAFGLLNGRCEANDKQTAGSIDKQTTVASDKLTTGSIDKQSTAQNNTQSTVASDKPPAVSNKKQPGDPGDPLAILETHCVRCHGGSKTKAGLDLVTREALLRGGESGPCVVPGDPDQSLLIQTIRHVQDPHMPRKAPKLADSSIARIADWIKAGAPYGRSLKKDVAPVSASEIEPDFTISPSQRNHWAFRPLARIEPTKDRPLSLTHMSANWIDDYIIEKLDKKRLTFAPPASKTTLIRRVSFDLVGLPPSPAEIDAFVNDCSPNAYERLIDRLLASPAYGERWGRFWLDLARYAETDGFEHDAVRPNSWRYRDYVIQSFNEDKPYNRFIREQIAGDERWPNDPNAIVATGFNLLGPDMVDSSDQVQRRHNTLNDVADTTALVFLGLTMGCAKCHDHKFEPISQRDYYALQAFFTPVQFVRDRGLPIPGAREAYEAEIKRYQEHPKVKALREIEAPVRERLYQAKVAALAEEARTAHLTPADRRSAQQANLVLETLDKVKISDQELNAAFTGEDKTRRDALLKEVKAVPKPKRPPAAPALADGDLEKTQTHILIRGDYNHPGDRVFAEFPTVLRSERSAITAKDASDKTSVTNRLDHANRIDPRRSTLADWIASAENPLTARVFVNRIWLRHFGRGLVATPSDFGVRGARPTHPELLDRLALEFIEHGWSVKYLHKLILLSNTYRQSALCSSESRSIDPENALYSRRERIRLEGEEIRDAFLAISGKLNRTIGGPSVFPPIPRELFAGSANWASSSNENEYSRRSIYIFVRRNLRFPFLEVFDAPDGSQSCPERDRSTTAPQALALLNGADAIAAAEKTANRVERDARSAEERIELSYRLVLGRAPRPNERAIALDFLAESPLADLLLALFNLNEFVYVE